MVPLNKIRYPIVTSLVISAFCLSLILCSCSKQENGSVGVDFLLDWKASVAYSGFFVAQAKGYYRQAGLEVRILDGTGAPDAARLIAAGKYKIGCSTGDATVMAVARGLPVTSVAVLFQSSPVVIFSLEATSIDDPQGLVGRRIGITVGDTKYTYYKALMRNLGIDRTTIDEVRVGWEVTPLLTGEVDALLGYTSGEPVQVEAQGREVRRIYLADYGLQMYSTNIVVNTEFLAKNGSVVRRFLKASLKGWEDVINSPHEALRIFAEQHPESDPRFSSMSIDYVLPLLESPDTKLHGLGFQTTDGWSNTIATLFASGMIDSMLNPHQVFVNDLLTSN